MNCRRSSHNNRPRPHSHKGTGQLFHNPSSHPNPSRRSLRVDHHRARLPLMKTAVLCYSRASAPLEMQTSFACRHRSRHLAVSLIASSRITTGAAGSGSRPARRARALIEHGRPAWEDRSQWSLSRASTAPQTSGARPSANRSRLRPTHRWSRMSPVLRR